MKSFVDGKIPFSQSVRLTSNTWKFNLFHLTYHFALALKKILNKRTDFVIKMVMDWFTSRFAPFQLHDFK